MNGTFNTFQGYPSVCEYKVESSINPILCQCRQRMGLVEDSTFKFHKVWRYLKLISNPLCS